jgi:type III secretory pathway component EscR
MYTVSTLSVGMMIDEPALLVVPRVFLYIALAAWTLACAGLLGSVVKKS